MDHSCFNCVEGKYLKSTKDGCLDECPDGSCGLDNYNLHNKVLEKFSIQYYHFWEIKNFHTICNIRCLCN